MAGAVNSTDDHSDAASADDARLLECVSGPDRTLREVESAFERAHAPGPDPAEPAGRAPDAASPRAETKQSRRWKRK